jgi:hypothetical protein
MSLAPAVRRDIAAFRHARPEESESWVMRKGSGRIGTLMLGSAIALALAASPFAIDWAGLQINLKSAEAKGDGGKGGKGGGGGKGGKARGGGKSGGGEEGGSEGGEGEGGSKGGEGNGEGGGSEGGEGGGSEGGEGDGEEGGSEGKAGKGGRGKGAEGGSDGDSDNDADDDGEGSGEGDGRSGRGGWKSSDAQDGESEGDDDSDDDGRDDGKSGKGKGGRKASDASDSDGDDDDGENDDSGDDDGEDRSEVDGDSDDGGDGEESSAIEGSDSTSENAAGDRSSASADQVQARRAAATASVGSLFSTPVIARNAAHRPAAVRRTVTVSIKTVRGLPPRDRDGFEHAGARMAAAPAPAASADPVIAIAQCAAAAPGSSCPPPAAEAAAPVPDIAPPAVEPAAGPVSVPDIPSDPAPDPTQTQLAYAMPRTGLEPEPRVDIDESIYGLMQVEAVRYVDTTVPILVVQGLVFNMSRAKRPVPPLVAIVSDADGRELARWKFTAEAPTLEPGASTGFRSETVDPAPHSTKITVVFALPEQPQVAVGEAPIEPR